jgi:mannose-6-phosphate isomerase-like protein (cupin superfamily)
MPNFSIAQLDELPAQLCPCGTTRRAFAETAGGPASVHRVDISENARPHFHKEMTEIYVVLEGEGQIELDGQRFSVKPMTSIMIKPGCRHRAVGKMKIINVAIPAFDPADEWFD